MKIIEMNENSRKEIELLAPYAHQIIGNNIKRLLQLLTVWWCGKKIDYFKWKRTCYKKQ